MLAVISPLIGSELIISTKRASSTRMEGLVEVRASKITSTLLFGCIRCCTLFIRISFNSVVLMVDALKLMDSLTVADGVGDSVGAVDAAAVVFTTMLSAGG